MSLPRRTAETYKKFHARLLRELQRTPGGMEGLEIYYDKDGVPMVRGGKVFGKKQQTKLEIINPKPKQETKTMPSIPTQTQNPLVYRGEYNGNPMLIIKGKTDDRFPFQFGLKKARLILENIEAIRQFVAESESKSKAA